MRMLFRRAIAIAVVALAPSATLTAQTVDQSQYLNFGRLNIVPGYVNGTSFTPSGTTSVGAGFYLVNSSGGTATGTLDVSLWTNLPQNGGTQLAFGSAAYSLGANGQSMFDAYWPTVAVTPGTSYFLQITSAPNASNASVWDMFAANVYPGGQAYLDADGSGPGTNVNGNSGFDVTFEEFQETPTGAPEPASLVLIATGLVGVASVRRRMKRTA